MIILFENQTYAKIQAFTITEGTITIESIADIEHLEKTHIESAEICSYENQLFLVLELIKTRPIHTICGNSRVLKIRNIIF